MVQLTLPQLSLSTEGGKALRRLGTDGDGIGKGQPVVEVERDKTTIGVVAIRGGIIRLLAEEGALLPFEVRRPRSKATRTPGTAGRRRSTSPRGLRTKERR